MTIRPVMRRLPALRLPTLRFPALRLRLLELPAAAPLALVFLVGATEVARGQAAIAEEYRAPGADAVRLHLTSASMARTRSDA